MTVEILEPNELETVARLAQEAVDFELLQPGGIYAVVASGQVQKVDLTGDAYRDYPKRKAGRVTVRDVPSFEVYYGKHGHSMSELYADREQRTVTGIVDAHMVEHADWQEHRVTLALKFSEAYLAWSGADGRLMDQEAFAEFLDDNRADIVDPSAAEMLEIAQTIQGTSRVDWQAGHRLRDGQRVLGYVETNTATAGTKGELAIPSQISLGVAIFDGAKVRHELTARFRHRIEGGKLRLMYKLDRPADVVTAAFDGVVAEVEQACGATVMRGTPA